MAVLYHEIGASLHGEDDAIGAFTDLFRPVDELFKFFVRHNM
ncbi:hypothetical protein [Sinorhizobium meliloti]|nr:hypothetical protein [Sinorhizobium meliloti]